MSGKNDEWQECAPGTLTDMARRLRQGKQSHTTARRAVVGFGFVGFIAAMTVGTLLINQSTASPISCEDAHKMFGDYRQGRLGYSDRRNLENHLERCPHCRDHYHNGGQSCRDKSRKELVRRRTQRECDARS